MSKKPKILLWDIETSLSVLASFSLYNNAISHHNILREPFILCAAWKWLHKNKVHGIRCTRKELQRGDDLRVVERLCNLVEEADIIIAHNGDKFDLKWLKGRALKYGLPPLNFVKTVDTLKVARKNFKLMSNRLDYIAKYLGTEGKMSTKSGLWLDVLNGDVSAIKDMLEYNKQDVTVLETVYLKLRPWIDNHPNTQVLVDNNRVCKACTSPSVHKHGTYTSQTNKYQKYKCQDCGHVFKDSKILKQGV